MWNWYYDIDLPKIRVGPSFALIYIYIYIYIYLKNLQNCDSKIQTSASKS